MTQINIDYRGFVISHEKIPQTTGNFAVNLASNDPGLLARIGGRGQVFTDPHSFDAAIAKAKQHVDSVLS